MIFIILGIVIFIVLLGSFWAYKTGKYKNQVTREEAINEAVKKAVNYRDHLRHDASYAERLREYFTRR